jgi:hypothetical protein
VFAGRIAMKGLRSIVHGLLSLVGPIALAPSATGQDIVSAVSGYVHFAAGEVLLDGEPFEIDAAEFVHAGDGQRLRTADGWVEVMILPGSFIRLAPHSELEMVRAGILEAHMRLVEGSAAIDLTAATETSGIVVEIRDARVSFAKSGSYRVDAPAGSNPTIRSNRGRAWVEWHGGKFKIGGGRELTIVPSHGKLKAKKFNRSERDALDRWDRERGRMLAEKARESYRGRETGAGALENSAIYRCRVMGRGCPASL